MGKNTAINVPTDRLTSTGHKPGLGLAFLAAAIQAATQEDADEILAVEEKLAGWNDRDLYLTTREDELVAPRIGGGKVKESTLRHLAKFEMGERERRRSERKWLISNIASWVLTLISLGVAIFLAFYK